MAAGKKPKRWFSAKAVVPLEAAKLNDIYFYNITHTACIAQKKFITGKIRLGTAIYFGVTVIQPIGINCYDCHGYSLGLLVSLIACATPLNTSKVC